MIPFNDREKTDLGLHVEQCAERYNQLDRQIRQSLGKIDHLTEKFTVHQDSTRRWQMAIFFILLVSQGESIIPLVLKMIP
jgi:hypothetical protein